MLGCLSAEKHYVSDISVLSISFILFFLCLGLLIRACNWIFCWECYRTEDEKAIKGVAAGCLDKVEVFFWKFVIQGVVLC